MGIARMAGEYRQEKRPQHIDLFRRIVTGVAQG